MSLATLEATPSRRPQRERKRRKRGTSLLAHGEPMVWLTGGALVICLAMIFGLLFIVTWRGGRTFWPTGVVELNTYDGTALMGEVVETDDYEPDPAYLETLGEEARARAQVAMDANDGLLHRFKLRTGNFQLTGTHFDWVHEFEIEQQSSPSDAVVVERFAGGRFFGRPQEYLRDGQAVASDAAAIWDAYDEDIGAVRDRLDEIHRLETEPTGRLNHELESARLDLRSVELEHGLASDEWAREKAVYDEVFARCDAEFSKLRAEADELKAANASFAIAFDTTAGPAKIGLAEVVRTYPANQLSFGAKIAIYFDRWTEFLTAEPRESNSEGGVFPAIFGTVAMTLIMSILVVPFGVMAALYLHEYAKQGYLVSIVRIAVGNLAGVPSIVFGVFGLGFFCYIIGSNIDDLFFQANLPAPTFGTGGLMWASLTLALLTLPVVIVATEEALAAVPNSMREGSYACGASKWQTIRRIVLPRAMPGIMTGMILAIARGAGEVAPLMLVGAAKLAPELPVDGEFPFIHPERSFMHLGFHIYDVGFQSQNSEAAIPIVFTTTFLLIAIVVMLNLCAMWIRARLRRQFVA